MHKPLAELITAIKGKKNMLQSWLDLIYLEFIKSKGLFPE